MTVCAADWLSQQRRLLDELLEVAVCPSCRGEGRLMVPDGYRASGEPSEGAHEEECGRCWRGWLRMPPAAVRTPSAGTHGDEEPF